MYRTFEQAASASPTQLALSDERGSVTFAELAYDCEQLQRLLSPGTIVMVALPSGIAFTAVQLACFGARAIFVPIPHQSTRREAQAFLEMVTPDVIVVASLADQAAVLGACETPALVVTREATAEHAAPHQVVTWERALAGDVPPVQPRAAVFPERTRTVQFTSGSTGRPKGILLDNEAWLSTIAMNAQHLGQWRGGQVFCPLPQFHAMGNAVVMEHLLHGTGVHVANDFDPAKHVARLKQHRCRAILASPNYFKLMIRLGAISAAALPDLQSFTIGTAAIDEALIRDMRGPFPDAVIYCRYGLSESVGAMVRLRLGPGQRLPQKGLIGSPVPGVVVRPGLPPVGTAEPEELSVQSGANAFAVVDATRTVTPLLDGDGFLSTGDLAFLMPDGQLLVRGRLSSFLKSNGYRINPFEIEELLRGQPGVQEAVVVGVPDEMAGQRIIACIEPLRDHPTPAIDPLRASCERELSPYKVPHGFLVLAPLPRTPAGKPDRSAIAAAAAQWQADLAAAETAAARTAKGGSLTDRVTAIVCREISHSVGRAVTVTFDQNLDEYLDSMALVSLTVALQEELEVTIPGNAITKENFASENAIVAMLGMDGSGFTAAPEAGRTRPVAAPGRNLLLAAATALAVFALVLTAPPDDKGPLPMRVFLGNKARCNHCADLVLAGSSQAAVNLSPGAMAEVLRDRRIINEGFSTQPYSESYLDMLERNLADSPRRAVLMLITPVSLIMRPGDDEAEYARSVTGKQSLVGAAVEQLRWVFRPRSPCEVLFGACSFHVYHWSYADGWEPETFAGVASPTAGVHTSALFMRRWGQKLRGDAAGYQHVLARVRRWRQQGIAVYTLRAPVPPEMLDAEQSIPGYDERTMIRSFADAGATWISVDAAHYVGFDGWHMSRPLAEAFSRDVAGSIARVEQSGGAR